MSKYDLLPFRFGHHHEDLLLVNEAGEHYFLTTKQFDELLRGNLKPQDKVYLDLKSKNFLYDDDLAGAIDLVATQYRSRKRFMNYFTALHMLVVTLRCNQKCRYCQVSCEGDDSYAYDMPPDVGKKVVDCIFQSPSPIIKIEFQGGEPTLNWETVEEVVNYAHELNKKYKRNLEFVLCTNLIAISKEQLEFCREYNIQVSTSLDGNQEVHDSCRVLKSGEGTYAKFIEQLQMAREIVGHDNVNALMTTSRPSLSKMPEIIDEYIDLGFSGIFIRALNPYGFASENNDSLGYSAQDFTNAYISALEYIIDLNIKGHFFVEHFTNLLFSRIMTPFSTGFVDLQSPSGAGISGVIYDYNGDVYPADEARMLARMGDQYFLMGNVLTDSHSEIFKGKTLQEIVSKSCLEAMPVCADCVYSAFCGSDPIRNYLETGDVVGNRPNSEFCKKIKNIFEYLFKILEQNDDQIMDVLWSWVTNRSLVEVRGEDN